MKSSKEKIINDYSKTVKNIIVLKSGIHTKKTQMYTLSKNILDNTKLKIPQNNQIYKTLPSTATRLTNHMITNNLLRISARDFLKDSILSTLSSKLVVKFLNDDKLVTSDQKKKYTKDFNKLNDSILFDMSLLDLEFSKLQQLDLLRKKYKI